MQQELVARPARYLEAEQHDLYAVVLNNIRAERAQLLIEETVLNAAIVAAQETSNGTAS